MSDDPQSKMTTTEYTDEHGIHHVVIDPGNMVVCDDCNRDFTNSPMIGGIYGFGSKAICPICTPKWLADAKRYGEERFIKARCPDDKPFADWVREDLR